MSAPWRTALVTGASSGIGRELAVQLAKLGVKVYAAARRLDRLEQLRTELGETIVPLQLDVADADATFARVQALDVECGGLELVVANAGVADLSSARRVDWPVIRNVIDVNVTGAVATLCGALPGMVQRGRGHLAGMASLAARVPIPKSSTYCASKAFLSMWLDSVRFDVKKAGVTVTVIQPGFVKSEATAKAKRTLPFLLETDDAVRRIVASLISRDELCAFPWQLTTAIGAGNALPRTLRDALARRLQ